METKTFRLWENDAPGHQEGFETPLLTYYPAENKRGRGTVLIFAGGAYRLRSAYEAVDYAEFLNGAGIDAFVLDYRVKPTEFPYPLLDARRAVRFIRANAESFGIDPQKIAVMGSSAGGHLAAFVSTYKRPIDGEGIDGLDKTDFLPNAQILCYPVLDMWGHPGSFINLLGANYPSHKAYTPYYLADKDTPPVFLWHTASDPAVDVNGSYRYAAKLHELGVPCEMHIYPIGAHGLGLADNAEKGRLVPHVRSWSALLVSWLILEGWIDENA